MFSIGAQWTARSDEAADIVVSRDSIALRCSIGCRCRGGIVRCTIGDWSGRRHDGPRPIRMMRKTDGYG